MAWSVVFLIGGIATLVLGVFSLVQRRQTFLGIAGIIWFCIVLFSQYIPAVYKFPIIQGVPVLGELLLFLALPVFLILAFFSRRS
jgi:hypothetical protein